MQNYNNFSTLASLTATQNISIASLSSARDGNVVSKRSGKTRKKTFNYPKGIDVFIMN
jgi:hypothetical protein